MENDMFIPAWMQKNQEYTSKPWVWCVDFVEEKKF